MRISAAIALFFRSSLLFAKAKAIADFLLQLNHDLEHGNDDLLRKLDISEEAIARFRQAVTRGGKLIVHSENSLQLIYRIQFRESYLLNCRSLLSWAKWTICRSPIDLPLSDIALLPIFQRDDNANYYVLPIGPKLLLKARLDVGRQTHSPQSCITGEDLTVGAAEYWLQVICLSAISELVFFRRIPDVPDVRTRAYNIP